MSGIPIINIWKSAEEKTDATGLFSEFKKMQALKKQQAIEKTRWNKVGARLQDISEELNEKSEIVNRVLSSKAYLAANDVLDFLKSIHTDIQAKKDFSEDDLEKEFFKFVSASASKDKPSNSLTLHAEMDDSGHLILCPNKDSCTVHKSHLGMGLIHIDAKDFGNE